MSNPFAVLVALTGHDASNTLAAHVFEHIEIAGAEPSTIFVVMRRLVNHRLARLRHDGPFLVWTLADGSQLLLDQSYSEDRPWFAALPNRASMDCLMRGASWAAVPWAMHVIGECQGLMVA